MQCPVGRAPSRGRAAAARWARRAALALLLGAGACNGVQRQQAAAGRALQSELAEVLVAHHAYEPALPLLQKRVSEAPDDARAHLMFGMVLRDRGLYGQAQQELDRAYHLDPNDADAAAALGVLHDLRHASPAAQHWHRRALELAPGRADLHNNLGFSLALRGDWDAAVAAYEEALRRDPGLHRVYNNLGFAQARQGDFEAALRSFQQGSTRTGALVNLGVAYELAGNADAACGLYEEALHHDRKSTAARRALDRLLAQRRPPRAAASPAVPSIPET